MEIVKLFCHDAVANWFAKNSHLEIILINHNYITKSSNLIGYQQP